MTLLNDSLSAYLTPLLEKHAAGKAIIYDDLIHSWQAASTANFDPSVSKHMRELHESQLQAYQDAARAALTEEAHSVALPALDEQEDDEETVEKALREIKKPDWKVNETVWEEAWMTPLRERIIRAASSDNNNEDTVEMDEEDGEVEEEEGEPEEKAVPTKPVAKKATVKKKAVVTKAGKGLLQKKALGAGKQPGAPGQRAVRGRRARRGGRGGGAGAAK